MEPIAIVGIGCRLPGGANSPASLWQLLQNGTDAIGEAPQDRLDLFSILRPEAVKALVTRQGGFLPGIDQFDPDFFGISPRETVFLDPQQRLLLEVTWEALEDAGQVPAQLAGSRVGVFIGMWTNEYEDLMFGTPEDIDFYMTTGGGRYAAAGRLSYFLNVEGPSLTLDTHCSSSLVAIHLACQSLETQECSLAIAGGANLILRPHISVGYSQAKLLSPDGRCKFGDAEANGYVRSEGVAVVVLKPLAAALADRDPIYALIRGSAVNNDGQSSGSLVMPSRWAQERVTRQACRKAGIAPSQLQYVEAHGSGTAVGDAVEFQSIGAVVGEGRSKEQPCLIGSVKTNVGHTEATAGVTGLIKVALSLKHRAIPASLHFKVPNPKVPWQELPVKVQQAFGPWPEAPRPALAGVNSFGISGTNAHVVLEEPPRARSAEAPPLDLRPQLLTLSAHSSPALRALANRYAAMLPAEALENRPSLSNLCYTASGRRSHHDHRLALVATSLDEVKDALMAYLQNEARAGLYTGHTDKHRSHKQKMVFVFPGQGAQWAGMGRQLLTDEPIFREAISHCENALRRHVDWSLHEVLTTEAGQSRLGEIDVLQPTLFSIQVSLAALWRAWGICPEAVVGHSMGEVAAAHVAGVLSLEDAAQIMCRRSQLLKRVRGRGAMAVVELSTQQATEALAGYTDRLSIAVSNSPRSTVLSGDPVALAQVLRTLERQGIFCRPVKVDVASHSPQMDGLRADLLAALTGLKPRPAKLPFYSTVTNTCCTGQELTPAYWVRNLREPVLFSDAVQRLLAEGHTLFIEISPHPLLLTAIQEGIQHGAWKGAGPALASMRRGENERAVMLGTLGMLYTLGYPVNWQKLYPAGGDCIPLPSYPWQRERFWLKTVQTESPLPVKPAEEGLTPAQPSQTAVTIQTLLGAAQPAQRRELLETYVREQIGQVLKLAPARIDRTAPFSTLGFDSLLVLELRNRLEMSLALTLSTTTIWNYPTLAALADYLADKLGFATPTRLPPPVDSLPARAEAVEDELLQLLNMAAGLSDGELWQILNGVPSEGQPG